jgi:hypothetical protein
LDFRLLGVIAPLADLLDREFIRTDFPRAAAVAEALANAASALVCSSSPRDFVPRSAISRAS